MANVAHHRQVLDMHALAGYPRDCVGIRHTLCPSGLWIPLKVDPPHEIFRKDTTVVTNDFETYWLTATNVVLGLVTLVCVFVLAHGLFLELKEKLAVRRARLAVPADDHAFVVPMLGVTMADGGERLDKKDQPKGNPEKKSEQQS